MSVIVKFTLSVKYIFIHYNLKIVLFLFSQHGRFYIFHIYEKFDLEVCSSILVAFRIILRITHR